jgi:hypothetical protein
MEAPAPRTELTIAPVALLGPDFVEPVDFPLPPEPLRTAFASSHDALRGRSLTPSTIIEATPLRRPLVDMFFTPV